MGGDRPRAVGAPGAHGGVRVGIVTRRSDSRVLGKIARKFEGHRYSDAEVSFFLVDCPPGGAALHLHPYEEVFVPG